MKKQFIPLLALLVLIIQQPLYSETIRKNDLRELFTNGKAVIYTIPFHLMVLFLLHRASTQLVGCQHLAVY